MAQDSWQHELRMWSEQTARRLTTSGPRRPLIPRMASGLAGLGWVILALAVLWSAGSEEARTHGVREVKDAAGDILKVIDERVVAEGPRR